MTDSAFPSASDLWRDANRTDYLVLPLAAGVLAHFVVASGQSLSPTDSERPVNVLIDLTEDARRVLEECRHADGWDEDPEPYARVRDLALKAWLIVEFWMPVMYATWKFDAVAAPGSDDVVTWLRASSSAPLVDVALAGILGIYLVTREDDTLPLLSRRARRIRVELAERMRRDRLTSWPQIVRTVSSQWVEGGAARFALDLATAARLVGDRIADAEAQLESRFNALKAAEATKTKKKKRAAATAVPSISITRHESVLSAERERSRVLEERLATLRVERDAMAAREGRLRSRIDALTVRLEAARDRVEMSERAQPSPGADSALLPSEQPTEAPVPADALAGRKVILFTGLNAGDVREAMRRSLLAYGAADVTVYWSDRELGPDVVPPDAIVVVDVRFMSHSVSEAVTRIAERSGAWMCVTQRGSALLGQEVALRFLQR